MNEKKRKYSVDSLEEEKNQSFEHCFEKLEETGLNAQLIAKNDKKLVKLRINSNYKPNDSSKTNTINAIDIDDLPSETDLVSGRILVLSNSLLDHLSDSTYEKISIDEENSESNKLSSTKSNKKLYKRTYICNECGKELYSQNALNKHMLNSHDTQKPFLCTQCQMSFDDFSAKKRHENKHLEIKQFRCCICSFEFTRASNLRTHLLKIHPTEVGKTVIITKSNDNKLNFEFNLDKINNRKNSNTSNSSIRKESQDKKELEGIKDNKVIYIKDPQNKNAEIQHVVIYIDGKPVFLKKSQIKVPNQINDSNKTNFKKEKLNKTTTNVTFTNRPVVKMPYLIAAAATTSSNQFQNNNLQQQKCLNSKQLETKNSNQESMQICRPDQDYLQIVSMLKQKNEKLVNPLI